MLSNFAAESGPHVSIAPEHVFTIAGIEITNSILYGWISGIIILIAMTYIAKRLTVKPKGGAFQIVEVMADFIMTNLEQSLGSRKRAIKYAPYFVTLFFFILLNNWLGLLPGVGTAITVDGSPLLRPFTGDLNGTLAMASITMAFVLTSAVRESGFKNHIKHYFNGSLKNPIIVFMGVFEMFSELTRLFSLALRLFLNVVIGEIIIAIFGYLGKAGAPLTTLPFLGLELFVSALQAYIFVLLASTYLGGAIQHAGHHKDEDHSEPVPSTPLGAQATS